MRCAAPPPGQVDGGRWYAEYAATMRAHYGSRFRPPDSAEPAARKEGT